MTSITIHNIDTTLDSLIRQHAKEAGQSLNKTIKELLNKALGIAKNKKRRDHRDDFKEFFGIWTREEFEEFEENTKIFEVIDESDWI